LTGLVHALPVRRAGRLLEVARLIRSNKLGVLGLAVIAAVVLMGLLAPLVAPSAPTSQDLLVRLQPPSWSHLLGTDELGRDVFSRLLYGARVSVGLGVAVVGCATLIGIAWGVTAGFVGGRVDGLLMRVADAFLAFPKIILAMAVTAALGPNLFNTFVAVTVTWWPEYARLARSVTLAEYGSEFVAAARVLGVPRARIVRRHIVPAMVGPLLAKATLDVGFAIVYIAGLSFIGFGVQPPGAEWGLMVSQGQDYVNSAWWIVAAPGLAILITAAGFNLFGEAMRDVLDPGWRVSGGRGKGSRRESP
jgi:peptide/nickel transport system permease protein